MSKERTDTERLDWLLSQPGLELIIEYGEWVYIQPWDREKIDEAMLDEQQDVEKQ